MRQIATSGGFELGSSKTGYLDIVGLPNTENWPNRLSFDEALADLLDHGIWMAIEKFGVHPQGDLRKYRGCIWVSRNKNVWCRFLAPPGKSTLDALYDIEEHEFNQGYSLPACFAAGWLAFTQAEFVDNITLAPTQYARDMLRLDTAGLGRVNAKEIARLVEEFIDQTIKGAEAILRPDSPVSLARYYLACTKALWEPPTMLRLGDLAWKHKHLRLMASRWANLTRGAEFTYQGQKFRSSPLLQRATEWPETCSALLSEVPPATLRRFYSISRDDKSFATYDSMLANEPYDKDLIAGVIKGLLRDAEAHRLYTPSGDFTLTLPENYPLRKFGIHALAVTAFADELLFASLDERGFRSVMAFWSPEQKTFSVNSYFQASMNATLAALWHDLVVAGDTVFVRSGSSPSARTEKPPAQPPQTKRGRQRKYLNLPRRHAIYVSGKRVWGREEDRAVQRAAHGVGKHPRKLHGDWQRSEEADRQAGLYNVVLPDGYTFVRPHIRGDGEFDPSVIIETVARAKGLNTIMAFLTD